MQSWQSLQHLFNAGLIGEKMFRATYTGTLQNNIPIKNGFMWFSSLRPNVVPTGYTMPDKTGNYLYISKFPTNGQTFNVAPAVLTPAQAFAIDSKMDDGLPMSGSVRASWVSYDCLGVDGSWRQGPCFNKPMIKSGVGTSASVDDSVTPPVYYLNAVVPPGHEPYNLTSIHIAVD